MNRQELKVEKKRRRKKKRPVLRRLLLITVILFFIVGGYASYLVYKTIQAANESYTELERGEKSKLREAAVTAGKDPISILLMGVEDYSSGGENGRTDSLIVATVNPDTKDMKLISIPRDTRVYIEEADKEDKINHAYVYGKKEATINAVENLLEIPIDYYATVNFNGFKEVVDEIGGVTVDVPFNFWEKSDENNQRIYFEEGKMKLNGEEALAYARMRKRDPRGDFGRNDRQKQIIEASIDKIMSPNNLLKLDEVAEHVGKNVETNLRISEALAIQQRYGGFNSSSIDQLTIEGQDEYVGGVYYFSPDEEKLKELKTELNNHLEHTSSLADSNQTEDYDTE
ncbi:LCP family protein [Metabacillus arenae]|uniref:LCP family protein n=1 Tax=Metabacillus arenae TaxID=2771434 RepID=A0A926S1W5_9BACI|nr:LCP family protein [Metabacillus arenae]MBD1381379.1 LCP family protein [Metabacillus arenae]